MMRKQVLFLLLIALVVFAKGQMQENILPASFALHVSKPEVIQLPEFNLPAAKHADDEDSKNGKLPLFSRNIPVNINLRNAGKWTTLSNGGRIWSVKIVSRGALALVPLFEKLYLPDGATLHAFMPGHEEVLGAFMHDNTPVARAFCTGLLHGDECVLEYYEPAEVTGKGLLEINLVGHAYRFITPLQTGSRGINASGACEVNVACSETNSFLDQKRSVARIMVVANGGNGFCSGALINNVRQDCTPYFLTAQHCSEGTTANQYAQWVFYFNYEASACNGTTGPTNKTVTGCTNVSNSNDNGGDTGSDFLLLQLNSAPNSTYNVYYSGWDNNNTASTSGVCIHHPDGDIKKISTYSTSTTSTSWGGSVQGTHWDVKWAATTNGHGVTEPGSSGSPLFNNAGQIIGTLTGGDSYCNTPNQPDQFGKLSYDWISNGTANNRRLKPWLDPDNTGATTLAGTNSPCGSSVLNDAGIQAINAPDGDLCNVNTVTPQVVLRNFGGNAITIVTINYTIDGNVFQYTFQGNLAAGTTTVINLPQVTLANGPHSFSAETILPNGQTDNNTLNDAKAISFNILPASDVVTLSLHTDDYGSETSWTVKDASNNVVAEGGPYSDVNGGEQINTSFCLPAGCYTFNIHDDYGDGMSDPFDGSFALSGNGTTYATLTQADFGYNEAHNFCIVGTYVQEFSCNAVLVLPNPSSGMFTLTFAEAGEKTITVFDIAGGVVMQTRTAALSTSIDLSSMSKAVYLLQTEAGGRRNIQKLILK